MGYTQTATLDLTWDSNSENGLAGYKVHYGISPSLGTTIAVNLGDARLSCDSSSCSFELPGLVVGKTYYVAITAYDTSDNESEKSNVASGVAHLPTTPTTTSFHHYHKRCSYHHYHKRSCYHQHTRSCYHHNHHLRFPPWFRNHQQR